MFTGIVQTKAKIISTNTQNSLCRIVVAVPQEYGQNLETGASIAINGVCLTVVEFSNKGEMHIAFDVIDETLRLTNLGSLITGDQVNLERSLKMGDELGGHIVSGHIQTTAQLRAIKRDNENCCLTFEIDTQWRKYVLSKGFIAVNGISLTVGNVSESSFNVHLIPETLMRTNLSKLTLEDEVNIELDQQTITIVETLERLGLSLNS